MNNEFKPGSFGFHELLDRSLLASEFFNQNVSRHQAANHVRLREEVFAISRKLYAFYQLVGDVSCEDTI